jgi:peptidoglycan/LPS O-acetylase OafA/YrhL
MPRFNLGRTILAILAGYAVNAVLVAATEQLLPRLISERHYFVVDLITQCLYEVVAGYLCSYIAKPSERRIAVVALVVLGLLVGTVSLITSWKAEPHWYGIALLSVWAPCVWIGTDLARRRTDSSAS